MYMNMKQHESMHMNVNDRTESHFETRGAEAKTQAKPTKRQKKLT
jgi:hypothetical protein